MARSKGHGPRTARDNPTQKLPTAAAENAGGDTEMQGHVFSEAKSASDIAKLLTDRASAVSRAA